jgi:hypothetical protein
MAQNWDINTLKSINPPIPNSAVWRGFSSSVSPMIIGLPVGMYLVSQLNHNTKGKTNALHIAGGIITSVILTQGIKYAVNRDRPYMTYPLDVHPYDISEKNRSFLRNYFLSFCNGDVFKYTLQKMVGGCSCLCVGMWCWATHACISGHIIPVMYSCRRSFRNWKCILIGMAEQKDLAREKIISHIFTTVYLNISQNTYSV